MKGADLDVAPMIFIKKHIGENPDVVLTARVDGESGKRRVSSDGADIHQVAGFSMGQHMGQKDVTEIREGLDIQGKDLAEVEVMQFMEFLIRAHPGVVDEHVNLPENPDGFLQHFLGGALASDIQGQAVNSGFLFVRRFFAKRLEAVLPPGNRENGVPVPGKGSRQGPSYSRGCSRDNDIHAGISDAIFFIVNSPYFELPYNLPLPQTRLRLCVVRSRRMRPWIGLPIR